MGLKRPIIAPSAKREMAEIWAYIAQESRPAADKVLAQFAATFDHLVTFPEMGTARPELRPDIRSYPVGNYLVFYRLKADTIEVAHVFHGRRDIKSLLKK